MSDLIYIGDRQHILHETSKAVLFCVGRSNNGQQITRYIPKSQLWRRNEHIYIPEWLAREIGLWNESGRYESQGYLKMFDDDDLPF